MSARRPRTSNRRYGKGKEERSTDRDDDAGEKSKQKKRKLSDLLGPPWSEDDLKHFYQSYRRHGRDWKKVAATFYNRTVEMVEVLYNMNKAYLSLPEGAASAAGLIAMMTDHYNILEDSRSLDEDSSKDVAASMPSNQMPARLRSTSSMQQGMKAGGMVPQLSGLSSYGGPSPAKKPRTVAVNRPRAVGKRTPRVPLMHLQGITKSGKLHLSEPMEDAEQDSFGDCDEFKVALTLASASQRAASPQISRTPACRNDRSRSLPVQNGHTNNKTSCAGSGSFKTKHTGSNMDDGASEESRDTDNGVVTKASTSTALERRKRMSPAGEAKSKLKKSQKSQTKKGKLYAFDNFRPDELKEECSCTEEGTLKHEDIKGVDGYKNEQASKKKRPPSQKTKKRSRQLFSGDERSGLDALATLADLSLNGLLPSPRLDGEGSSMRILELSKDNTTERIRWSASEDLALHTEPQYSQSKETLSPTAKGFLAGRQKEIHCTLDIGSNFESDVQKGIAIAELRKRKRRGLIEKRDPFSDGNIAEEDRVDAKLTNLHSEDPMARTKLKRIVPGQGLAKYTGKPVKQEPDLDLDRQDVAVGESEVEIGHLGDMVNCPVKKQRSRRKSKSSAASIAASQCSHALVAEEKYSSKVRLTHCLSSEKVRRWCIYEWFYSAIDLPWFARNEFVEYLNHAGLGHVPRLTRAEWGVIRGSLGKPRRLSKRFLKEERDKLESYRDSVRKHYQEVRLGQREGLPTDLPRPLTVGQRVIARHPKTKEVYNGSILTVDRNRCRVQFDRPEMGVELVADIDCMPVNSFENLSDTLIPRASINDRLEKPVSSVPASNSSSSSLLNALCKQAQAANTVDSVLQVKAAANEAVAAAQQAMFNQPCSLAQVQAKEADIRALADLSRALDKKEAILVEIRNMHDDANANQRDGEAVRTSDVFKKQYATLVLQLREVNQQVCGALLQLRQRNKFQENCLPPWHRSSLQHTTTYMQPGNLESNAFSLEQFPLAKEVTVHAKQQARLMVNTAVESMLSIKEGEDAMSKICAALNHLPKANFSVSQAEGVKPEETSVGINSGYVDVVDWANGNPAVGATKPANGKDSVFLADLMSTCVATLLMVQAFTERQFPPAEIAMAFDSILASLRPCSSQNYQIYSEIQHYASLLKNQIIALIPTQSLPVDCPPLPH
ncbi:hypothetical protein L7F22_062722 [Adiantum nelumboides]|nr:hypothetical protein [Adiantum nelumboides]